MKKTEEDRQPGTDRNKGLPWQQLALAVLIFFAGAAFGFGFEDGSFGNQSGQQSQTELPRSLDYSSVDEVYESLRENYDGELSADELLNGLKQGLAQATGDPYTEYLSAEASQEFDDEMSGTFTGIGAELGKDEDSIIVVAPLSGFPAEEAGLRPMDVIIEVDGESTRGLSITEVVEKIRGPEGSDVELTIGRDFERLDFTITRDTITVASVEYELQEDNIGYIKVSRFGTDTVGLVTRALDEFEAAGVTGIILDLRSNPGGLLNASVEMSDLWLPKGAEILEERRGEEVIKSFAARNGVSVADGVETIILVNEGSASASEIVAGALRDNDAATIIGMTTFGKGSVQQLDKLRSGGTLKVTIARWYTPNGKNIDKEGIEPDTEIERTEEDFREDRDPQLNEASKRLRR